MQRKRGKFADPPPPPPLARSSSSRFEVSLLLSLVSLPSPCCFRTFPVSPLPPLLPPVYPIIIPRALLSSSREMEECKTTDTWAEEFSLALSGDKYELIRHPRTHSEVADDDGDHELAYT